MSHFFDSRRSTVLAQRGMVATSQPLAAQAGLQILMAGGNAVDAAVAAAATLTVVEPMSTGLGGDMFCLIWNARDKKMLALNSSGRSPAAANPQQLIDEGYQRIPFEGQGAAYSITVPGIVAGWEEILKKQGRMSFKEVLQPAIMYAKSGFPVSEVIAYLWQEAAGKLQTTESGQELLLNGRAPRYGEIVKFPSMAKVLENLREGGSRIFYEGALAKQIADFVQAQGGWLTKEDLAHHQATWDTPINTDYRGVTVWECPPNGQGLAALLALNIAENFDIASMGEQSADRYHYLIESMRLSFADARHYITDPSLHPVPVHELLHKNYAKQRAGLIKPQQRIAEMAYGNPYGSDTVYISAVDSEGNACSLINSTYHSFGSGLVVPNTGISLQNRGASFSLNPEQANYLEPCKRPYHTIIPAMATKDNALWLSFGVMGAFQQPQGHLQVISNMVDFGLDPQKALDALRFSVHLDSDTVKLEAGISAEVVRTLEQRYHRTSLVEGYPRVEFGGGQIIARDVETGLLYGGSDPRKDGGAVGY